MIERRSFGSRAGIFGLFLFQVVLAGAAPAADARLEAEASHAGAHLESESTDCRLGHDHGFCLLCRAIDTEASPAAVAVSPAPIDRPSFRPVLAPEDLRACTLARLAGSPRAPPAA